MKKNIISVKLFLQILFLLFLPQSSLANEYSSINYTIQLLDKIKSPAIRVETEITGNISERLVIYLPTQLGDINYVEQIKNIKVLDPNLKFIINKKDYHQLVIDNSKSLKSVKFSYEIHPKQEEPVSILATMIRNDFVHAIRQGLLGFPIDTQDDEIYKFNITWKNIPYEWKVISSYGTKKNLNFTATIDEMLNSIYEAGILRLHKIDIDGKVIAISLHGEFDLDDEEITSSLIKIIKAQRSFFNDLDFPYYSITLISGKKPFFMTGDKLNNSFSMIIPKDIDKRHYFTLFAHENLHNWIGGKIRNNEEEFLNYWWSEGFTEYHSRLLLARSEVISFDEFIVECNELIKDYYLSPVLNITNAQIKEDYWENYEVLKLPYNRGFVFAIHLNHLIKKNNHTKSLDNVLLDLFKAAKQEKFSADLFKKIVKTYLPSGIETEIAEYINNGKTIELNLVMKDLPLEKIKTGRYDLGFDKQVFLTSNIIRNIDINSNAYKAGLREGDKATEFNIPKGRNSNEIVTITINNKTFKFKPENPHKKIIYQFKKNLSDEEKLQIKNFFGIN